jgi:hypothetical protein
MSGPAAVWWEARNMNRFTRSLALARASWNVLLSEKEMLGFTLLGAIFTVVAVAVFALPGVILLIQSGGSDASIAAGRSPLGWALMFVFYLVISFVTLFFNTALIGAALVRLRGGQSSFSEGMQIAVNNLGHIFVFALISATVGLVLALIEDKFRFVGQIVGSLLGAAWAVVTFLVVPVMVTEGSNPLDAIKRSGQLLRKTWGEQIIGSGGISIVMFLVALLAVIPIVLGVVTGTDVGLIAGVAIAAIYLGIVFLVGSALGAIFRAAVYLYAETGTVPNQFDGWMLQSAFRPRRNSEISGNI